MRVDTNIKLGAFTTTINDRAMRPLQAWKIKTGIKAGPTCPTCSSKR
jgi:hypothetical protein